MARILLHDARSVPVDFFHNGGLDGGMIRFFRQLSESLQRGVTVLEDVKVRLDWLLEGRGEDAALEDRVAALERAQDRWQAKVEAEMTRVEARFKAVRASEERARALAHQAAEAGGLDAEELEDLPPDIAALYAAHGAGGRDGGVQPVSEDLEGPPGEAEGSEQPDPLEIARRVKYGG